MIEWNKIHTFKKKRQISCWWTFSAFVWESSFTFLFLKYNFARLKKISKDLIKMQILDWDLRFHISNCLPGDADATGPQTTLWSE